MPTIDQQIEEILTEIRKTPYHKGTERHLGLLKAKVAKLKAKREAATLRGSSGRGISYAVKKQGDATIVLVGPPSAGKSTLLNKLTNARSKVAPYAFTTVSVIPGMMKYHDAELQVLDVPGLIEGAETGKGRGREVLSVIRGADLVIIMSDTERPEAIERICHSLEENGIRLNKTPPAVTIEKKLSGGILVHTNLKLSLSKQTIKDIANEMGIKNAEISINENLDSDRLIDAFSRNRVYVPALFLLNKADLGAAPRHSDALLISAEQETHLDLLRDQIWAHLGLVRVYLVRPSEPPSAANPLIVKSCHTLADVAEKVGTEFAEHKTRAKLWGKGAKFPGQEVSLHTRVAEGMQIRFI